MNFGSDSTTRNDPVAVEVGTIGEIHARLNAEGYRVSLTSLRTWVKGGIIPAVYSGVRAYINYANVLKALQGDAEPVPPDANSKIRRIE